MLLGSLLPVMFLVTRKTCWLFPQMKGDRVWGPWAADPCSFASQSPATQATACAFPESQGTLSKYVS